MEPGRLDRRISILQRSTATDAWNQNQNSYVQVSMLGLRSGTREPRRGKRLISV